MKLIKKRIKLVSPSVKTIQSINGAIIIAKKYFDILDSIKVKEK